MPDITVDTDRAGATKQRLDASPPQPPRQGKSLMSMATDQGSAIDMSSPAVQVMSAMGDCRNRLLKLASLLPGLAPGIQQFIQGLEQVVPQQVADMVAGMPPGSGGSGMGAAPQAGASPTAPPVQTGMP
jgi:hypothetical protein